MLLFKKVATVEATFSDTVLATGLDFFLFNVKIFM